MFFMKNHFLKSCNSFGVKCFFSCLTLSFFMLPVYGRNILQNGNFSDGLLHWKSGSDTGAAVVPYSSGGPDGGPFIRLKSLSGSVSCSQLYCGMPKNEKFKITCFFRIKDKSPDSEAQIVILCLPDKHYLPLKGEVGKWVKFEQIFTSTNGGNYLSFQLKNGPGTVDIARASIEPLAEDSKSSDIMEHAAQALVPMANMHALTAAAKTVRFQYSGKFPLPEKELQAVFYVKENPRRALRLPISDRAVMVDMGEFGSKSGTLQMALQDKNTGREYLSAEYAFEFVDYPAAENAVRLNNLVTELFNGPMPGKMIVKNPRRGWIFCRFIPDDPAAEFAIKLNGKTVIDHRTLRRETVRFCEEQELIFENSGMPEYPVYRVLQEESSFFV